MDSTSGWNALMLVKASRQRQILSVPIQFGGYLIRIPSNPTIRGITNLSCREAVNRQLQVMCPVSGALTKS
jgi:hypothetical protein